MARAIANPECPRRDNDLQLPTVLFSILDKSKGKKKGLGGEEGGCREEILEKAERENTNVERTGSKQNRSSEER